MSTIDDYKKLRTDISAKKFKPVYLLHGEEAFFIDRLAEEIERNALEEHEREEFTRLKVIKRSKSKKKKRRSEAQKQREALAE